MLTTPKENGDPSEGKMYNIITKAWEELDVDDKEELLGFHLGDTATLGVTEDQRSTRIGRTLDGKTMR